MQPLHRRHQLLKKSIDLDSLSDVTLTSAANGDFLQYNGSAWVNIGDVYAKTGSTLRAYDSTDTDYIELLDTGASARLLTNNNNLQIGPQGINASGSVEICSGNTYLTDTSAGNGYILATGAGDTTHTGYLAFYTPGTRRAYFGWHDGSSRVEWHSENSWGLRLDSIADILYEADTGHTFTYTGASRLTIGTNVAVLDNGGASPIFEVRADDSAPWAVQLTRSDYADNTRVFAHKGDGSNIGWVFEDTPYIYNGGAYDKVASVPSVGTTKIKSANESVTSSTTMQDDDHLVSFSLTAGKWYEVTGLLSFTAANTTPDIKAQLVFTNTPNNDGHWGWVHTDAAHTVQGGDGATAISSQLQAQIASRQQMAWVFGVFQANATTGGTMKLQWAQLTSSATSTTMLAGSYLTVRQLD